MKTFFGVVLSVVLIGVLLPAETRYATVYRNPQANLTDLAGKKIACFVVIPSAEFRNGREETVAEELRTRGLNTVAGYTVLPGELVKDLEKAKAFLNKAGVAGAVMLRLINDEKARRETTAGVYTAPSYSSFWGYWGYGWSQVYVVETSWKERVITLETLIYSIDKDQLLWAGQSETTSPKDIKKFVKDLMDAAGKELRKAGLVPK